MKEILALIFIPIAVVVVFLMACWEISVKYIKQECETYAIMTDRETRFVRPSWGQADCYVKTDNGWFFLGQINQNNVSE